MTQEEKNLNNLLLKDLCARLPYGVKCKMGNYDYIICDISLERQYDVFYNSRRDFPIGVIGTEDNGNTFYTSVYEKHVKPYLFPLSSMTEEQKYDFYCRFIENDCDFNDFKEFYFENNEWHKMLTSIDDIEEIIDWFNKNHFDYRCLIPKGLAIDATDKNIY